VSGTPTRTLGDNVLDLKPGDRVFDPQAHKGYLVYGIRIYDDYDNGMLDTYFDLICEDGARVVLQGLAISHWERL